MEGAVAAKKRKHPQLAVGSLVPASAALVSAIRDLELPPKSALKAGPQAQLRKMTQPGKERWSIKVGLDAAAPTVGQDGSALVFVDTTVEQLSRIKRPDDMLPVTKNHAKYKNNRASPIELTIFRLEAEITGIKLEDDGDLHIVLRGASNRAMIAEAPTARAPFVTPDSPWFDAMAVVRKKISTKFGKREVPMAVSLAEGRLVPMSALDQNNRPKAPPTPIRLSELLDSGRSFATALDPTPVRITGVGFFDRVHGQNGVAPNGIELHPLLDIEFI